MANRQRNRSTTTPAVPAEAVQQPAALPAWMDPLRPLVEALDGFLSDPQAVNKVDLRSTFALARQDETKRGLIDRLLGESVVIYGVEPAIFVAALGDDNDDKQNKTAKYRADLAAQFTKCAGEAEYKVGAWSKAEARKVIEAWRAKHPAAKATGGLMSRIASRSSFPYGLLESWATKERHDATNGGVSNQAVAEIESAKAEVAKARVADLEDAVAKAKAAKIAAAAIVAGGSDDGDDALESAKAEVKRLMAELETARAEAAKFAASVEPDEDTAIDVPTTEGGTTEAPVETAPAQPAAEAAAQVQTATYPVDDNTPMSVDEAETACTAPSAGRGLRRAYERWDREELDDQAFVAKVQELLSIQRNATA